MTDRLLYLVVMLLASAMLAALVYLLSQQVSVREADCIARGGRVVRANKSSTVCTTPDGRILENEEKYGD